jgi:hypothetical protein
MRPRGQRTSKRIDPIGDSGLGSERDEDAEGGSATVARHAAIVSWLAHSVNEVDP